VPSIFVEASLSLSSTMGQGRRIHEVLLTTTYTDTALCEELVSLGAKLNSCWVIFDRLDEPFCEKLIKDSPSVRFQIHLGAVQ
jgi:hypothetical protein